MSVPTDCSCLPGSTYDLSLMHAGITLKVAIIAHAGESPLPGLTDETKPKLRGPKRATKIRKLFNLSKDDDVRKCVPYAECPPFIAE